MKYYSIGEFSELIENQLNHFLGIKSIETKKVIGYCRASSHKLIQNITVFSCRLQGKRANKA